METQNGWLHDISKRARNAGHAWQTIRNEHHSFLLLLLAFVVFRALSILLLRPGGFLVDSGPDQYYYLAFSRFTGSGQYPFVDFWMEYPPLMPWLATLAYRLSLLVPVWDTEIFWFNLFFRLFLLPFDAATLAVIYAIVGQFDSRARALQVAGLWALLFAPFFTMLSWFDPMTLFFMMLGLYGLLTHRPALAGIAIGLGFMAKVLPIAISPIGLFTLKHNRHRVTYVGSAIATVVLVLLPFLLTTPAYVLAHFRSLLTVSSWETVWALLEGYNSYGLVAPLSTRHDPAAATFSINATASLPWYLITPAFGLLYGFLITRKIAWQDKRNVALFAVSSLVIFVLHSKGYSPQWATYLSTMALLALPVGRGLGYGLLFGIFMIAEWPVAFAVMAGQEWFLAAIIVSRTLLILFLGLDALSRALPEAPAWLAVKRFAYPGALAVSLGSFILLANPAWDAYRESRLQQDDLAPFIASRQEDDNGSEPLILLQSNLLERLRPYLGPDELRLYPSGHVVGDWLAATLNANNHAWLLYENGTEYRPTLYAEALDWIDEFACPVQEAWFGTVLATHFVIAPPVGELALMATFDDSLSLMAATPPGEPLSPADSFCVRLTWVAKATPATDYAMFVHVLAEDGQLVSQSDQWPPSSTSTWPAGQPVETEHGLVLPPSLPAGKYGLFVGLYALDGGERLPLSDGQDALKLADLVVEAPPR